MGWTIEIAGVTPLTIDENAKFNLRTQALYNEAGKKEFIETFIEVEVDIVDSTPSDIADSLATVRNQVSALHFPRNVTLKLNGTTKFEFLTASCVASPRIELHETIDEEGNGDSHWRYKLGIYVKQGGNAGGGVENVFELQTSIKTIKDQGKITRKIWMASCKAKTLQEAQSFVNSVKPSKFDHEEIERFFQDQRVTGSWVWEARQEEGYTIIEGPMEISGRGQHYVTTPRVGLSSGSLKPIIHEGRYQETRIRIRGVVRGDNRSAVMGAVPGPHFTESDEMVRLRGEEMTMGGDDAVLVDPVKGIYEAHYDEVWLSVAYGVPSPNHGTHQVAGDLASPPADGSMPSYSNI
tara:strand:+ start:227 stop:1279 length:1053 start_codon:yes stop_codon:yes gene_type:complete